MSIEPTPFKPKVERRREILYGTPGTTIYKNDKPVLWIPDDFGSLTKNLQPKDLEALLTELKKYLEPHRS
jgi:hypothetical protein